MSFGFFFLNKENDFMRFYVFDGFCQVVPLFFLYKRQGILSLDKESIVVMSGTGISNLIWGHKPAPVKSR